VTETVLLVMLTVPTEIVIPVNHQTISLTDIVDHNAQKTTTPLKNQTDSVWNVTILAKLVTVLTVVPPVTMVTTYITVIVLLHVHMDSSDMPSIKLVSHVKILVILVTKLIPVLLVSLVLSYT
jgi:hypothetical protein